MPSDNRRVKALAIWVPLVLLLSACGELAPRPTPLSEPVCAAARHRILSMTSVIIRADRVEAKRMTAKEFVDGSGGQLPIESDPQTLLCVLAIAGDIRQPGGALPVLPRTWSVHVSVEATDQPLAGQYNSEGVWPSYFDALPSR